MKDIPGLQSKKVCASSRLPGIIVSISPLIGNRIQLNLHVWACDSEDGHCVFEGRRLHDYTQMHEYPAREGATRLETYCTLF